MKAHSNKEMLQEFQSKLDELLEVDASSDYDDFTTVIGAEDIPEGVDAYFIELKDALDEEIDYSDSYQSWQIRIEQDGMHIVIFNLDGSEDEFTVGYDDDIEYDTDADVERIMKEMAELRAETADQDEFTNNISEIKKIVNSTFFGKYYAPTGAVPNRVVTALHNPDAYDILTPVCKMSPKPKYMDQLVDAGYGEVYMSVNSSGDYECWTYENGDCYHLLEEDLDFLDESIMNSISIAAGTDSVDEATLEKIYEISERYATSNPVSGDWDTETLHEFNAIKDECGLSDEAAMDVMIDYLGYDPDDLGERLAIGDVSRDSY